MPFEPKHNGTARSLLLSETVMDQNLYLYLTWLKMEGMSKGYVTGLLGHRTVQRSGRGDLELRVFLKQVGDK